MERVIPKVKGRCSEEAGEVIKHEIGIVVEHVTSNFIGERRRDMGADETNSLIDFHAPYNPSVELSDFIGFGDTLHVNEDLMFPEKIFDRRSPDSIVRGVENGGFNP